MIRVIICVWGYTITYIIQKWRDFYGKTFLMVKPDGVQRAFIGEIVARFEKKGFQLVGAKLMQVTPEIAGQHYAEHKEKPFFGELVDFITSACIRNGMAR